MERLLKIKMTTTRIIATGFFLGIFLGGFLLWLPVSSRPGESIGFIDALFVATTSLCVTGLTPVVMAEQWSLFGQVVILFLMQFGGLGVVTFTTTVLLMLGKRISLSDRLLIQDAYNLDSVGGVVKLTMRIIKGTLFVELCGAVLYSFVFVPEYGAVRGIWYSVWHAVSAFCNAGLDVVSPNSFIKYQTNGIINITTMLLIIIGGIGFPVWWDLLRVGKSVLRKEIALWDSAKKLMVHTKLAVSFTLILIFGGALVFFLLEYGNPATIGTLSFGEKVLAAFFESVTLRTAGFQTIAQENLTEGSTMIAILLMFIGGSPSGAAGGVKTVTVVVLFMAALAAAKGNNEITVFRRKISDDYVRKAMAVVALYFIVMISVTMILCVTETGALTDIIFEVVSALATVGLTRGFTGSLTLVGKIFIIATMYIGRTGPITMMLAFNTKKKPGKVSMAEGKVIIG